MTTGERAQRIAIHGAPRSGTTWVAEILNSSPQTLYKYQPLFSYALKDALTPDSSVEDVDSFFGALESTPDSFMDQSEARERGTLPTFQKSSHSHIVYKEVRYHHILANLLQKSPDLRLVACIRNPFSVINSWLRAPREFRADLGWKQNAEWRYAPEKNRGRPEEFNGYERWKECVAIFLQLAEEHPGRVHLLQYRDLLASPVSRVRALFDFCSLEVTEPTLEFLRESVSRDDSDVYSVYRVEQSDEKWKTELASEIVQAIEDDLRGHRLARFAVRGPDESRAERGDSPR